MKKAAIYLRVSTDLQDYERQKPAFENLARALGYDELIYFEEKASAVEDMNTREQLTEMRRLTNKDIDRIFIWDISRLSRRSIDFINLVEEFAAKKICLHFYEKNIITLDNKGEIDGLMKMYLYMLGMFAEMEAENLKAKMKSGKEAAFAKGNSYTSRAPFGYKIVDKKLLVDENESVIVQEIFQLYKEGKTLQYIADMLNTREIPMKCESWHRKEIVWVKASVYRILTNTIYYGEAHRRECIKKAVKESDEIIEPAEYKDRIFSAPKIVSKELWIETNALIPVKKTKVSKIRTNHFSLLRGLIKCGLCGKSYVTNQQRKDFHYTDAAKRGTLNNRINCPNKSIQVTTADTLVWNTVRHTYEYAQSKDRFEQEKTINQHKIDANNKQIELFKRNLTTLDTELKRAINAYVKGLFDDDTLAIEKTRINKEVERLSQNITDLHNENIVLANKVDALFNFEDYVESIDNSDEKQKKQVCKELLDSVLVYGIDYNYRLLTVQYKVGFAVQLLINVRKRTYLEIGADIAPYNKDTCTFLLSLPDQNSNAEIAPPIDKEVTPDELIALYSTLEKSF